MAALPRTSVPVLFLVSEPGPAMIPLMVALKVGVISTVAPLEPSVTPRKTLSAFEAVICNVPPLMLMLLATAEVGSAPRLRSVLILKMPLLITS